jgi:poly-gamma-glutamate synthesis protein (capsule biosynthesis protein)
LSDAGARAVIDRLAYDRRPGDITIVSIHWGPNWGYDVLDEERRFAHALIDDAGVAIVHGHSSHHPRSIEIYRDRLILYGCGDFLNDYEGVAGYEHYRGDLAAMYFVDVDAASGALFGLTLVPLQIRNFQLQRPGNDDIGWLYRTLSAESGKLGTTLARTDDQRLSLEIGRPTR